MAARLSDEALLETLEAIRKHGSKAAAGRALGLSRTAVSDRWRDAMSRGLTLAASEKDLNPEFENKPLSYSERVRYNDTITKLRREIREMVRENISVQEVREEIYGLSRMEVKTQTWTMRKRLKPGAPGIPQALLSDLHWGEVVRPEEVGGYNEFNLAVANRRLKSWAERVVDLCFNYTVNPEHQEGLIVPILGDLFSGSIHEELHETNEMPVLPCIQNLVEALLSALRFLAGHFGKVELRCVEGNHDRVFKAKRLKRRVWNSYGWHVYCLLEKFLQGDDRFTITIAEGPDLLMPVANLNVLYTHGDEMGVKGGDGIIGVIGPIKRGSKKLAAQYRGLGQTFDCVQMGHWHQAITLKDIVVNNALKGYDEYAATRGRYEPAPASQVLIHTHPKYGNIRYEEVFVQNV